MKRFISIILVFLLCFSIGVTTATAKEQEKVDKKQLHAIAKKVEKITDKQKIAEYAKENNIPDSDTIDSITLVDYDYGDTVGTMEWGSEEIELRNITNSSWTDYSRPFRQSTATGPVVHKMSINDSISVKISNSYTVSAEVLEVQLGIDVTAGRSITDSAEYNVTTKCTSEITAYTRYYRTSYEIWEVDAFYDDYKGKGYVDDPYGVAFIHRTYQ